MSSKESTGNFERVQEHQNLEDKAERLAAVGAAISKYGISGDIPGRPSEALEELKQFRVQPVVSGAVDGGGRVELGTWDGYLTSIPTEKTFVNPSEIDTRVTHDEIVEDDGEEKVVYEAEISQGVLAEDAEGVGLWTEEPAEDIRLRNPGGTISAQDIVYISRGPEDIFFTAMPKNDHSTMHLDYESAELRGAKDYLRTELEEELENVEGVEFEKDAGYALTAQIDLDASPEKIEERVDGAYSAAKNALEPFQ